MTSFDKKKIKATFYLALKNEIDNFTHSNIKNRVPNRVKNQSILVNKIII